jgi:hypothetical protein
LIESPANKLFGVFQRLHRAKDWRAVLESAGGAAPSSASLDLDNVAGETDKDWSEGRTPLPEDRLPDGGSGGSASVVPDDFGTDWTAEIGNCDVRMNADHDKITATTEVVSSPPVETRHWSQRCRRNTSRADKKTGGGLANGLAKL